ncbi:MAG: CidA/LrgA family protein [Burkholderiaceae bacterium]|nr:CidA/LrgA family protein [Roseateles sp.]MBV8470774.1 CidA/LrgA family protein [Burkholderiaceae bacterium]
MLPLQGLALLLLLQTAGEALSHALHIPIPGPVLGLVLLLAALRWDRCKAPIAAVAEVLLGHLSLLFVPVGVGVITHLDLLGRYGWQLLLIIIVSTLAGMATTAWVLQRLLRRSGGAA